MLRKPNGGDGALGGRIGRVWGVLFQRINMLISPNFNLAERCSFVDQLVLWRSNHFNDRIVSYWMELLFTCLTNFILSLNNLFNFHTTEDFLCCISQ
jgi:hypothetical protein